MRPERDRVHTVAAELNSTVADRLGITLHVLGWHDVSPNMGRIEKVILDEFPVEQWDIFIGILWLRFGLPPGEKDPETGEDFKSGTEEEFKLACRSWKKIKRPRIMFYRCVRAPASLKGFNHAQFAAVETFFEQFNPGGTHEGLCQEFQTTDDFERRVRHDLTKLLFEYGEKVLQRKLPQQTKLELPADDITQNYLAYVRKEHGSIRIFGFLSHANIDVHLLHVFVSLRFSESWRELEKSHSPAIEEREDRELTPMQVLQRAMQKKKSLLILGGPGSGKTTLLKYFAVCCLDAEGRERIRLQQPLIPIFVPLRQIDPSKPFCEALGAWAKAHNLKV